MKFAGLKTTLLRNLRGYAILIFGIAFGVWSLTSHTSKTPTSEKLLDKRVKSLIPRVEKRLKKAFVQKNLSYPPYHVTVLYIKDQKKVYVYAGDSASDTRFVQQYEVLASIGSGLPKRTANDNQFPEGIYPLKDASVARDPKYISLRIDYPNEFDQAIAEREKIKILPTDIVIHGTSTTTRGLAIGNSAIEELFVLAANGVTKEYRFVFVPTDLREQRREKLVDSPPWLEELDRILLLEMMRLQ